MEILQQIWNDGQNIFMIDMARQAGFFTNRKWRDVQDFLSKNSGRRARFFTTLYPIYPVPSVGVNNFLTRPDETRRDHMQLS